MQDYTHKCSKCKVTLLVVGPDGGAMNQMSEELDKALEDAKVDMEAQKKKDAENKKKENEHDKTN